MKHILSSLKYLTALFLFSAMILLLLGLGLRSFSCINMAINFTILYFGGIVLPFTIHETAHFELMKRLHVPAKVERKLWRISIIPLRDLQPIEQIKIALAGSSITGGIGGVLLFIGYIVNSGILIILAYFYLMHFVFLLPCFGDGRAILQAACKKFRRS